MLLVLRREWKVMLEGSYRLNHGEHSFAKELRFYF